MRIGVTYAVRHWLGGGSHAHPSASTPSHNHRYPNGDRHTVCRSGRFIISCRSREVIACRRGNLIGKHSLHRDAFSRLPLAANRAYPTGAQVATRLAANSRNVLKTPRKAKIAFRMPGQDQDLPVEAYHMFVTECLRDQVPRIHLG